MDGTSRDDWLTALSFVYPVMPLPDVTWDNLEVRCECQRRSLHSVHRVQPLQAVHYVAAAAACCNTAALRWLLLAALCQT
jgi:hypothetical protein